MSRWRSRASESSTSTEEAIRKRQRTEGDGMVASKTRERRRATVDVFVGGGVKGDRSGFVIGRVEVLLVGGLDGD